MAKQEHPSGGSQETGLSMGHSAKRGWAGQARVACRMDSTLLSLGPHSQRFADGIVVCFKLPKLNLEEENFWVWIKDHLAHPSGPRFRPEPRRWKICNSLCTEDHGGLSWSARQILHLRRQLSLRPTHFHFASAGKQEGLLAGPLFVHFIHPTDTDHHVPGNVLDPHSSTVLRSNSGVSRPETDRAKQL